MVSWPSVLFLWKSPGCGSLGPRAHTTRPPRRPGGLCFWLMAHTCVCAHLPAPGVLGCDRVHHAAKSRPALWICPVPGTCLLAEGQ